MINYMMSTENIQNQNNFHFHFWQNSSGLRLVG